MLTVYLLLTPGPDTGPSLGALRVSEDLLYFHLVIP